jgi:hypothetical protein
VVGGYLRLPISLDELLTSLSISPTGPVDEIAVLGNTDDLFALRYEIALIADNRQYQTFKVTLDWTEQITARGLNSSLSMGRRPMCWKEPRGTAISFV